MLAKHYVWAGFIPSSILVFNRTWNAKACRLDPVIFITSRIWALMHKGLVLEDGDAALQVISLNLEFHEALLVSNGSCGSVIAEYLSPAVF